MVADHPVDMADRCDKGQRSSEANPEGDPNGWRNEGGHPDMPLVTILTPSYNQAQFLEETILSVLGQDYPNIEYLILDGGSTDGSVEIIRKYRDRLAYWVSEPDQGQSHAINKGLRRANGEILAWINSDDYYRPGAVRAVVDFLKAHSDVALVYGRADLIDADGAAFYEIPWMDFDVRTCLTRQWYPVPQPAAFFRRTTMQKVGLLDERLHYCMDWDYWIRIAMAGLKVSKMPQALARCRLHRDSKTVSELLKPTEEMAAWVDRFFAQPLPSGIADLERQSRSRASLSLGRQHLYADQYSRARQAILRGIIQYPRTLLKDRAFLLLVLTALPGRVGRLVIRLKRRWLEPPPALEVRLRAVGAARAGSQ